jgi:hypothetical protein
MPPRKKQRAGGGGGEGADSCVLAASHARATMPAQRKDRHSGCWVPPVVAIANFYGITELPPASRSSRPWPAGAGGGPVTSESVHALRPGDDDEEACEVLEDISGPPWLVEATWGDQEAVITENEEVVWGGPTSESDFGTRKVSDAWWNTLVSTIAADNVVLLLVERLEGGKDKGNTHYLLVLGYEEEVRRRGGNVRKLWLKDPMGDNGDTLLRAELWDEPAVELLTYQPSGSKLDRFTILEATHLRLPVAVEADDGTTPAAAAAGVSSASASAAVASYSQSLLLDHAQLYRGQRSVAPMQID